jgi:amphi-Trp domain-containing protein
MGEKHDRDVEKVYSTSEFVAKLRRLADSLEAGERFEIRVAGERVYVPARAEFNVEHEREGDEEEIEFQRLRLATVCQAALGRSCRPVRRLAEATRPPAPARQD